MKLQWWTWWPMSRDEQYNMMVLMLWLIDEHNQRMFWLCVSGQPVKVRWPGRIAVSCSNPLTWPLSLNPWVSPWGWSQPPYWTVSLISFFLSRTHHHRGLEYRLTGELRVLPSGSHHSFFLCDIRSAIITVSISSSTNIMLWYLVCIFWCCCRNNLDLPLKHQSHTFYLSCTFVSLFGSFYAVS